MRAAAISLTLGAMLLALVGSAQALGFGPVVNGSTLGQPLDFAAAVRLEVDESLARECVTAEVQSGEAKLPAAAVRVSLEAGADARERQVRVTTLTPIDEPIVTVNVTAGCNPSVSRSFVTLIDPPLVRLAQADGAPAVALAPQRADSPSAPAAAVVPAAEAAVAPRPAPRAMRDPAGRRARAVRAATTAATRAATLDVTTPRPRRTTGAPTRVAQRPAPAGPRLKLEQAALIVAMAASAPPRSPEPAAPALAASASAPAPLAAASTAAASVAETERRRIAALEENIAALRESTERTQLALATLQARLNESEAARYANPLVYALAVLAALLSLGVAVLWWRQSQSRGGPQWWIAPAGSAASTGAGALRPGGARRALVEMPSGSGKLETEPAVMDDRANRAIIEDMPPRLSPPATVKRAAPAVVALPELPVLRRELSVEELIDLEQQADFFIVLGQDEAAIDLLMGHVRSSGGASPLPYLKLLEIYRRRGEREAYERVRERFNRRFNAYAPDWDTDLQQGKALDEYPKIQTQLQRLWDEPSRVTALLDDSLMRHGDSGENFELPAYRELLFLYSIARDLIEHPAATAGVDLLLPLGSETREPPNERLGAGRLTGFAPTDIRAPSVDLDVSRAPAPEDATTSDFHGLVGDRLEDKSSGHG